MRYRLFISDFDGTLVRADGTVSKRTQDTISRYVRAGGVFAVCTGRALTSILPRVRELGIKGLVAAFQGSVIADIETGKIIRKSCISTEDAVTVLQAMEKRDLHIHAYTTEEYFVNKDDELLAQYERVCGISGTVIEGELLSKMTEREHIAPVKILAAVDPKDRIPLARELQAELGEKFFVTCSADCLVEVIPHTENKGEAVKFLSKHYGVPISKTAAIGDQLNDLPMLEAAGGKFAVENAQEELKEIATVTPSVEDDGVAYALEEFAMKGKVSTEKEEIR